MWWEQGGLSSLILRLRLTQRTSAPHLSEVGAVAVIHVEGSFGSQLFLENHRMAVLF